MNTDNYEKLKNFYSSYFHEDWLCEAESPMQMVHAYLQAASNADAAQLRTAIMAFIENESDDEALEKKLMTELGCYYLPSADGLMAKAWLMSVADLLKNGNPTQ